MFEIGIIPPSDHERYSVLEQLVRIARQHFIVSQTSELLRKPKHRFCLVRHAVEAVSKGLRRNEAEAIPLPKVTWMNVHPDTPPNFDCALLCPGTVSRVDLGYTSGSEAECFSFVNWLLRSSKAGMAELNIAEELFSDRREQITAIPRALAMEFCAALRVDTCLEKLEWYGIDMNKHYRVLLQGLPLALKANTSLRCVRLLFETRNDHYNDSTDPRFAIFWESLASAFPSVTLDRLEIFIRDYGALNPRRFLPSAPSFTTAAWSNGSLHVLKIMSTVNPVRDDVELVDFDRLELRNRMLKSAGAAVTRNICEFVKNVSGINAVKSDPTRDVHDISISALYEATRKFFPSVVPVVFSPTCRPEKRKQDCQRFGKTYHETLLTSSITIPHAAEDTGLFLV